MSQHESTIIQLLIFKKNCFTLHKIPTTDIEKKIKAQFYELGSDNKIFDRSI